MCSFPLLKYLYLVKMYLFYTKSITRTYIYKQVHKIVHTMFNIKISTISLTWFNRWVFAVSDCGYTHGQLTVSSR